MRIFLSVFCAATSFGYSRLAIAAPDNSKRLKPLQVVTGLPKTGLRTLKTSFSKDAILPWTAITVSTLGLYAYDQQALEEVQRWGRNAGIGNSDDTKTVASAGPYPIFRLPSDTGSALYFLGDGWTHFTIASSFFITGQLVEGNRANNTGLEIVHGMIASTFFSQVLKRSTGRESPSEATKDRGSWRPFPDPVEYGKNTPKYDAFPSGHIMTATLTFTVINANYPEYSYLTLPVAGVWITALGLQMMNNGVHWASDYPLGIAMGYVIGKISTKLGEPDTPDDKTSGFIPIIYPGQFAQTETINALWTY
jgi:hypothetical protein